MKSLFGIPHGSCAWAFGLIVLGALFTTSAAAQLGTRSIAARAMPLGGGISVRGITRPLGGFSPGFNGVGTNRGFRGNAPRRPLYGYPYAYSVWVPDYFDYLDYQNAPYAYAPYGAQPAPPPYYDSAAALPTQQQPVIINQYFSGSGPQQVNAPEANNSSAQTPGDPIGNPQNYYLIAYKNHEIYPALAYWLEDKTLHYVTTQNTHNQASLDLIDLALTKSLNKDRDVPFSLPGQ